MAERPADVVARCRGAHVGAFADALALDQRVSAARAQRELGWRPLHAPFTAEAATYAAAARSAP